MTEERPKLEVGMILLGGLQGKPGEPLDHIWAVSKVGARSAHIVSHHGTLYADATLNAPHLPEGWYILPNKVLAMNVAADINSQRGIARSPGLIS